MAQLRRGEVQAQPQRGVHRLAHRGEAALELVADRDPQGYDGPQPLVALVQQRRELAVQAGAVGGRSRADHVADQRRHRGVGLQLSHMKTITYFSED